MVTVVTVGRAPRCRLPIRPHSQGFHRRKKPFIERFRSFIEKFDSFLQQISDSMKINSQKGYSGKMMLLTVHFPRTSIYRVCGGHSPLSQQIADHALQTTDKPLTRQTADPREAQNLKS